MGCPNRADVAVNSQDSDVVLHPSIPAAGTRANGALLLTWGFSWSCAKLTYHVVFEPLHTFCNIIRDSVPFLRCVSISVSE